MEIEAIASSEAAEAYDADVFEQEVGRWFETARKTNGLATVEFELLFREGLSSERWNMGLDFTAVAEKFGFQTKELVSRFKFDETDYDANEIRDLVANAASYTLLFKAEAYSANDRLLSREAWHFKKETPRIEARI